MHFDIATVVTVIGLISTILEIVSKYVTNRSLFERLFRQYRSGVLVGVLILTGFMAGILEGKHLLWVKVKPDIDGITKWANTDETDKKEMQATIERIPIQLQRYKQQCKRVTAPCALLYEYDNFEGRELDLPPEKYPDLRMYGFNDTTSSSKLQGGAQAEVFEHINEGGQSFPVNGNIPSLTPDNFEHKISSLIVRIP